MSDKKVVIQVLENDLTQVTRIDEYIFLAFTRSFYSYGKFTLKIDAGNEKAKELTMNRLIMLGNNTNKVGIIKHIQDDTSDTGTTITVEGYELKGILSQRYTIPPASQDQHSFSNIAAETVLKTIVQRNCIDLTAYAFPNFEVATDTALGDTITFNTRYKKLSDEVENVGKNYNIGHSVDVNFSTGKIIFDTVFGIDRTQGQSINPRAIFAIKFDNVETEKYTHSTLNCYDSAIIAGQGEGAAREIEEINGNTGFAKHVTFIDARDITGTTNLIARGNDRLAASQEIESFDNTIYHNRTMVYEIDWDLGDYVTVISKNRGITLDKQITEVTESYDNTVGFSLDVVFGDSLKTINDIINEKTIQAVE